MVQLISKFDNNTLAALNEGKLYMWGKNDPKRIPTCTGVQQIQPKHIPLPHNIITNVQPHGGYNCMVLVTDEGAVVEGEFFTSVSLPRVTITVNDGAIIMAKIIHDHLVLITSDNVLYTINRNISSVETNMMLGANIASHIVPLGLDFKTDKILQQIDSLTFTSDAVFILTIHPDNSVTLKALGKYGDFTWDTFTDILPDSISGYFHSENILLMDVSNDTLILYTLDGAMMLHNELTRPYVNKHPFMFSEKGNFLSMKPVFEDGTSAILGHIVVTRDTIYISRNLHQQGFYAVSYTPPVTGTYEDPDDISIFQTKEKVVYHQNIEPGGKYMKLFKLTDSVIGQAVANIEGTMVAVVDDNLTNCHIWGTSFDDTLARVLVSPTGFIGTVIVVDELVYTMDMFDELSVSGYPRVNGYNAGVHYTPQASLFMQPITFKGENN